MGTALLLLAFFSCAMCIAYVLWGIMYRRTR